jgi:hypothetical protein
VNKSIPIQTILRQHSAAIRTNQEVGDAIDCARQGVMGTFVYVPEFGNSPISGGYMLDAAAAHYEKQQGWTKDCPERAAFRARVERYRQPLADLLALKEEWRIASGLEALETRQWDAIGAESKAWKEILGRLKARKDSQAIARYLGKNGAVIAPNKLQDALRVIGKVGAI